MRLLAYIAAAVATSIAMASAPALSSEDLITKYEVQGSFETVIADVEDAIVNKGYVIDNKSFIGDMLKRTGADVGAKKELFVDAQILQFCSATLSRQAMEVDIDNVAYCPYGVFAYEAKSNPGTVVVGYRRLPAGDGRDAVNEVLDQIAKEAAGM